MRRWFKYWRVVLALLTVFLAGSLVGFVGGVAAVKKKVQQSNMPEHWAGLMMRKLNKELNLTEEQRKQATPLLQSTTRDLFAVRKQATISSLQHLRTFYTSLEPILTDEQKRKLEQAKEKMKQNLKKSGEGWAH